MTFKHFQAMRERFESQPKDTGDICVNGSPTGRKYAISIIPVTHNPGWIELLVDGWAVKLYADGQWEYDADTTGG